MELEFVRRKWHASRDRERGEGRLKAVVYLTLLIIGVYLAVKLVPLYVAEYELTDKMGEQARFAIVNRYTDDQIKDNIFKTIQDLDIPAKRDDVKVANTHNGLSISVEYTVPVDLMVYKTDITFSPSTEGRDYMK
jgi:hypothetical protein